MNNTFTFQVESVQKKFIIIGIENSEKDGQPYRILARTKDDLLLKEIYVFYSTDKTSENMTFVRKYI
jgi:hypothetical protein